VVDDEGAGASSADRAATTVSPTRGYDTQSRTPIDYDKLHGSPYFVLSSPLVLSGASQPDTAPAPGGGSSDDGDATHPNAGADGDDATRAPLPGGPTAAPFNGDGDAADDCDTTGTNPAGLTVNAARSAATTTPPTAGGSPQPTTSPTHAAAGATHSAPNA